MASTETAPSGIFLWYTWCTSPLLRFVIVFFLFFRIIIIWFRCNSRKFLFSKRLTIELLQNRVNSYPACCFWVIYFSSRSGSHVEGRSMATTINGGYVRWPWQLFQPTTGQQIYGKKISGWVFQKNRIVLLWTAVDFVSNKSKQFFHKEMSHY